MLRMRWRFSTPSASAAKKVAPYVRLIKLINVAKSIKPDYGRHGNFDLIPERAFHFDDY